MQFLDPSFANKSRPSCISNRVAYKHINGDSDKYTTINQTIKGKSH